MRNESRHQVECFCNGLSEKKAQQGAQPDLARPKFHFVRACRLSAAPLANENRSMSISKSQSHGKVGEAAVYAKCWMHGIPAYSTGGLRANFAGSDLIVETNDSRSKLWVQVKTGAPILKGQVYLTQCSGENELTTNKFKCDFVVFVNLETQVAKKHAHTGELDFNHLSYFIVPVCAANTMYRNAVNHLAEKPKRDGGKRKLGNMAVHVPEEEMVVYKNAWHLLKEKAENG